MSDPIASLSSSSPNVCSLDDDPSLTCEGPPPTAPRAANSCEPPARSAEPAISSSASDLAQKFLAPNHSAFIAASSSPAGPPSPSPNLTVRPDQLDFQTGLPRLETHTTFGHLHLSAGVDFINGNAHLGSLNQDGSQGENIGLGANLLNGELTLDYKGWSLSVGVGASLGGSIASGEGRDIDADGSKERCFKMTLGPFTLGECDEL